MYNMIKNTLILGLLLTLSRRMDKTHHDLSRFLGVLRQSTSLTSSLNPALYLASHGQHHNLHLRKLPPNRPVKNLPEAWEIHVVKQVTKNVWTFSRFVCSAPDEATQRFISPLARLLDMAYFLSVVDRRLLN